MTLTVGSLFSGIGGLDLGLERAGMRVIWQSEIDPYACKVLSKHWPEVVNHGDIKKINWKEVERPNVICGGYPCQPFSNAGKRRGEEDPRHLWPWVREAISQLRPDYAILENVRGHLSLGGLSVIGELATIGYDAEWRVVSAASVGANHRRDRIIIVAYPNQQGSQGWDSSEISQWETSDGYFRAGCADVAYPNNPGSRTSECGTDEDWQTEKQKWENQSQFGFSGCGAVVAHSDCGDSPYGGECSVVSGEGGSGGDDGGRSGSDLGQVSVGGAGQSASSVSDSDSWQDGGRFGGFQKGGGTVFPGGDHRRGTQEYAGWQWWQIEPDVGRVANGIPNRVDRLKGLGNAVVPQVAEVIGRLVVEHWEEIRR